MKKMVFLTLLLNVTISLFAQDIYNLQKEWEKWEQHPQYTFFQIGLSTTSSIPNVTVLKTRGNTKGIIGKSFPMFHLKQDSLSIVVKIKYKSICCKNLFLTFHSIGENMNVMEADTLCLSLSENWSEQVFSLSIKPRFSLECSLEAEGLSKEHTGDIFIADLSITSDGHFLDSGNMDNCTQVIPKISVKKMDELLNSSLMDKKILALGEAIHGTQTLNVLALELIKERVLRHNCRLIVLELPLSISLYLNRYVKNDQRYTIETISKFVEPYSSFYLIPLLQWLKEYNIKHNNEITLLGVDGEAYSILGKVNLYKYIDAVNSEGLLDSFCYDIMFGKDSTCLDTHITRSLLSDKESQLLKYCIYNMKEYQISRQQFEHRDEKMAEMMQFLCDMYLDSITTATFYGHLMHSNYVMSSCISFAHNSPSMGSFLKKKYQDDYSCLSLSVGEGNAWYLTDKNERKMYSIQKAPFNSLEHSIYNEEKDTIGFISMTNFDNKDVSQIRMSSARFSPNQFSFCLPKAYMDGILVVKKARQTEKQYETYAIRENFLNSEWIDILKKLQNQRNK